VTNHACSSSPKSREQEERGKHTLNPDVLATRLLGGVPTAGVARPLPQAVLTFPVNEIMI
jgi:hypothetical protein